MRSANPDAARVECRDLGMVFQTPGGPIRALEQVTFDFRPGEFICLVGPSGCGKTTLLRLLAGLIRPTEGEVRFPPAWAGERLPAALVFQDHALFPWMTLADNVSFGLAMRGQPRPARRERARAFLAELGLAEFGERYPHELSAGMRQRGALARALLVNPPLLLLDEPFGALDAQTRLVLQEELIRIWQSRRQSVVFVTHDIEEAIRLGDRVLILSGRPGRVRADIPVPLERPRELHGAAAARAAELKRQVRGMLDEIVRRDLRLPA